MQKDIINQMAKDMSIIRYSFEDDTSYATRVIYSALSEWIKVAILDRDVNDEELYTDGVSKIHVTQKCEKILEAMLAICPEAKNWFYPTKKWEYPIREIRKRLEYAGYIVSGINNSIQLSSPKYASVYDGFYLYRGDSFYLRSMVSGLGTYIHKQPEFGCQSDIKRMFFIPDKNAVDTVRDFENSISRSYEKSLNETKSREYFNFTSYKSFSESWDQAFYQEGKITVYRNGIFDYGLAKFRNRQVYIYQFPKAIISTNDVRRFMYGIKGMYNMECKALIRRHGDAIKMKIFSALPLREQSLLHMMAWPSRDISDITKYIIPVEFTQIIQNTLNNLNIKILEE
ncbi:MAG TPA: hypothetical protein VIO64_04195 [Pseudobacteroides sp.]|uniref:hypothetical protein n=1 Tax=Pseudobacteroides sp. TaxID=1968840 RepID=UPI002F932997